MTRLGILEDGMKQLAHNHLQANIGQLEQLAMTDSYPGSRSRLYSLVESVCEGCGDEQDCCVGGAV